MAFHAARRFQRRTNLEFRASDNTPSHFLRWLQMAWKDCAMRIGSRKRWCTLAPKQPSIRATTFVHTSQLCTTRPQYPVSFGIAPTVQHHPRRGYRLHGDPCTAWLTIHTDGHKELSNAADVTI